MKDKRIILMERIILLSFVGPKYRGGLLHKIDKDATKRFRIEFGVNWIFDFFLIWFIIFVFFLKRVFSGKIFNKILENPILFIYIITIGRRG